MHGQPLDRDHRFSRLRRFSPRLAHSSDFDGASLATGRSRQRFSKAATGHRLWVAEQILQSALGDDLPPTHTRTRTQI